MKEVGTITFAGYILNVYNSLDDPMFLATEVAQLIGYSDSNASEMLKMIESDEKHYLNTRWNVTRKMRGSPFKWFVTELGLYNILSQSRKPIAKGWRRIVHEELIEMRRSKGIDIKQQFDIWDEKYSNIYFDEETGRIMQSVTVPGGDVIQLPYEIED